MRSKLFVPATSTNLFPKALASQADAISFDLEDSVAEDSKEAARAAMREFLQSEVAQSSAKTFIVRVNPMGTPNFEADVSAVIQTGLAILNIPKCESRQQVQDSMNWVVKAEAANRNGKPVSVLANIETPKALRCAAEIGIADSRVVGLQMGYADLFEPHGIKRYDYLNVHAALFAMRMAAAEAGVFAFDGAFPDVQDEVGLKEECEMAKRLGYIGKTCIHPSQIKTVNQIFLPTPREIDFALRVLAAARDPKNRNVGVFQMEGRMIDRPFIQSAQNMADKAAKRGSLSP
jgi:citrate lyase subunit beta/citryl-CoA lyase